MVGITSRHVSGRLDIRGIGGKENKIMATKLVALDAGHGLKTAGKQTPTGIKEWTLNDKVRDKVVSLLKDYDVSFIFPDNNEGKTDESLSSRLSKYIAAGAHVMVSIHHNAYTGKWNNATGVEVYTDKNPTAKDTKLAKCIYDRLVKNTGLKGREIKQEDWYVINQDKIPAVLVEGGFMDSNIDYDVITSDAGQTAYAKAVAEGLIEFLRLSKKTAQSSNSVITAKADAAKSFDKNYAGVYNVNVDADDYLSLRAGANTNKKELARMKKGDKVQCYGYYTKESDGTVWLYVIYNGTTGYASKWYLK